MAVLYAVAMLFVKGELGKASALLWKYLANSLSSVALWYRALRCASHPGADAGRELRDAASHGLGLDHRGERYGSSDCPITAAATGGMAEFLLTGSTAAKL